LVLFALIIFTAIFDVVQTINKPYDVDWFATHNSPIKTLDKTTGLIATDYNLSVKDTERYMDCGSGGTKYLVFVSVRQTIENLMGNFNVLVKKIDENTTKVTINVFFSVTLTTTVTSGYSTSNSYKKITCNGKGLLEKKYLKLFQNKLNTFIVCFVIEENFKP
jgi:hypothetical protein